MSDFSALLPPLFSALWLSLWVTFATLMLILPIGLALALLLAFRRFPGKVLLETLLTLPLVLPPTVIGYGLLLMLGRGTPFGYWLNENLGIHLLFTWQGIVLATTVMALPLFVRTVAASLSSVDAALLEAAHLDGASYSALLFRILIPLSRRGLLAGILLSSARALGEFGASLMVGGSIPHRTETLPLSLYNAVQGGQGDKAWILALSLLIIALVFVQLLSLVKDPSGTIN